jgi:hypothetical protein
MAVVNVAKIKPTQPIFARSDNSLVRLSARKIGLDIPEPDPSLPKLEQEAGDIS